MTTTTTMTTTLFITIDYLHIKVALYFTLCYHYIDSIYIQYSNHKQCLYLLSIDHSITLLSSHSYSTDNYQS